MVLQQVLRAVGACSRTRGHRRTAGADAKGGGARGAGIALASSRDMAAAEGWRRWGQGNCRQSEEPPSAEATGRWCHPWSVQSVPPNRCRVQQTPACATASPAGGDTVILMTLSLSIPETPTEGRGGCSRMTDSPTVRPIGTGRCSHCVAAGQSGSTQPDTEDEEM